MMNCLVCKSGDMKPAKESYFAKLKNCYVIIENVPYYKCDQCGETVYSASVMERIDDILEQLENVASKIFILDYSSAA
ncbi:type II toxin-antitoxin system MqsA family antitoxin [uncultured Anaerovibrio sp.]|uniref:type II toxin-antitoxin system MqsA family antitoxin n=1 Tax=uncultured Anaerovibrio sp. TaxID=361586 RepID=UPI0026352C70|nr:type II toxin-antitoxin system MqsA family antitoxin [uncultured Anaerovibrio sp.]